MKRSKIISAFAMLVLFFLGSCGNKAIKTAPIAEKDSVHEPSYSVVTEQKDSTLYGVSGECGMSTFCLITNAKDTMYVTRTSEDGKEGMIYGDLNIGDRYCMITRDNNQALVVAINLTQLDKFIKNRYKIFNGHILLTNRSEKVDTMDIAEFDADQKLVLKGSQGNVSFKPIEK